MVHQRQVAVAVDSSCCLPRNLLDRWGIHVVPHELIIQERSYRDGVDIDPAEFYRLLQANNHVPTTSSPKPAAFLEAFRRAGSEADSVVCVTLSAGFSATYQSARSAAIMAEAEGTHVVVVDSGAAAGAAGLMALEAARTAQSGGSTEDVVSRVEDLIPRVNLLAFLDTLYYLRRSGRVPLVAAWASSLLGIKPLTELKHGKARLLGKPRTRARATERLLAVMRDRVGDAEAHVNVMHAKAAEDAQALGHQVESEFNCREVFISEFTPVMGAHLGPGLLGVAFHTEA